MALTSVEVKRALPQENAYELRDADGLFLRVYPTGVKKWVVMYYIDRRRVLKTVGEYPDMSLTQARRMRNKVKDGREAVPKKKIATFQDLAQKWLSDYSALCAEGTRINHRLYISYTSPIFKKAADEITRLELVELVRRIRKEHSYDTACRVAVTIGQIFRHAINAGMLADTPAEALSSSLIASRAEKEHKHFTTITDEREIGKLLRAIVTIRTATTRRALLFLAYTFPRPGELRLAKWKEFDTENRLWRIPAEHTKRRREHIIPLSRQALAILNEQKKRFSTADDFVFPSTRTGRELGKPTLGLALKALRQLPDDIRPDEMDPHGFRAMASTLLNVSGLWRPDAIERELSHQPSDKVRAAYNRADYMEERIKMMQWYADKLDALQYGDVLRVADA